MNLRPNPEHVAQSIVRRLRKCLCAGKPVPLFRDMLYAAAPTAQMVTLQKFVGANDFLKRNPQLYGLRV